MQVFNEDSLRAAIVDHWGEHGAHADVFDTMLSDIERMRDALLKLKQWDMLTLTADGHGSVTADAPWAQQVIDKALNG